ncbi:MAG: nuclear transport factor 2 family protein [Cyclobacteriaceae bacterium]|nr:nuclear transport factor 2 family protein [Cyclobacteriaceae bacterium]
MKHLLGSMLLILAACTSPESEVEKNTAVAQKLFEAFNKHNWKAMSELYAEPAQFLDPSFGPEVVIKSRSETIAKYSEMQAAFPDVQDAVQNIYPSGETVTIEFISTGTAPDGTKFSLPIVSILTIRDGLIVKDATYYDL